MKNIILTSQLCNVLSKILEDTTILEGKKIVGFIQNAADVYENKSFVVRDRESFLDNDFHIVDIDLCLVQNNKLEKILNGVDIIFVSGGNTFYLLEKIKKSGFNMMLQSLLKAGKIYIGSSAGSVVIGNTIEHVEGMDDSSLSDLKDYSGLNIINKKILPHYGNKKYLEQANRVINLSGKENFITISNDEFFTQ